LSWLYNTAAVLVACGLSVAGTLLWLRRKSGQHRQQMDALLGLREALHQDLLGTLAQPQPSLTKLGLGQLGWQGLWYGTPVSGGFAGGGPEYVHRFDYDDVSLLLRVTLKGVRGERRLFAVQAAQVLFAMVEGALAARELALSAAVSQRARVGVFLQHDMRNMAQWVQLIAEDFEAANSDTQLLALAQRMRSNAAFTANRAQRMGKALLNPAWQPSPASSFGQLDLPALDVADYVQEAAQMHQVQVDVSGAAQVCWDEAALVCVLDNALGNVSELSRAHMLPAHCNVVVSSTAAATFVRIESPHLPLGIALEKLFEPWASSGNVNKGLGLYQARKLVQLAGGELSAERMQSGICVTLCIPCKNF
jgi:signal transduction histidine kinase